MPEPAHSIGVVVPCFNEAARLQPAGLTRLLERAGLHLYLVDDGSTDSTAAVLEAFAATSPDRVHTLSTGVNVGKGEAVRTGLRAVGAAGHGLAAYYDADLATSPADLGALIDAAQRTPELMVVLASRVALLGHRVRRRRARHYVGRVFATASSLVLRTTVYDTQCGAKVLRTGAQLDAALREPFMSRWAFDVELLGRLLAGTGTTPPVPAEAMLEVPVWDWEDVEGSRLGMRSSVRAVTDLARIRRRLRQRR